jgi:hypothetical protein
MAAPEANTASLLIWACGGAGESEFACETLQKLDHPSCYGLAATLQSFKSLWNSGLLPL